MTLHLTGCWYTGMDDAAVRHAANNLRTGVTEIVSWRWAEVCLMQDDITFCIDALERMAGTPKETPDDAA